MNCTRTSNNNDERGDAYITTQLSVRAMFEKYVQQHPNNAKVIVFTEAYLQMRLALMKQVFSIENMTKDSILSGDADIKKQLLPKLKRALKGLEDRFKKAGYSGDVTLCAQYIIDMEKEYIKTPAQRCKYYNGSNDYTSQLGFYEQLWLEKFGDETTLNNIIEYIYYGLMRFAEDDNTPISLKAMLFNRYCHWVRADVDGFKQWYNEFYVRGAQ